MVRADLPVQESTAPAALRDALTKLKYSSVRGRNIYPVSSPLPGKQSA